MRCWAVTFGSPANQSAALHQQPTKIKFLKADSACLKQTEFFFSACLACGRIFHPVQRLLWSLTLGVGTSFARNLHTLLKLCHSHFFFKSFWPIHTFCITKVEGNGGVVSHSTADGWRMSFAASMHYLHTKSPAFSCVFSWFSAFLLVPW